MKKKFFLAFILILAITFSSCEKDDICAETTATTPRLIVTFYDVNNPSVEKNVTSLEVTGEGMIDSLQVFNSVSSIEIPLSIAEDSVTYIFELNSNNANINQDLLKLNYTRTNVYVSRACGYKTIFALDPETPFELTDNNDGLWIQEVAVVQPNIENEDETHVSIYF
ncbi:MAG TPA: DUF6452 family protein [Flavobacterium sp.]|jgi:hypothetical protein